MPPAENEGHRGRATASARFYPEGGRAMRILEPDETDVLELGERVAEALRGGAE